MEFEANFKFLKMDIIQRKNAEKLNEDEKNFISLHLLDDENNPCRFLVFNKEVIKNLLDMNLVGLQDLLIEFKLVFRNDMWQVQIIDLHY